MTRPRPLPLLAAAALALAAGLDALLVPAPRDSPAEDLGASALECAELGETLLHRLPWFRADPSTRMPLLSLTAALLSYHLPEGRIPLVASLSKAAPPLLAAAAATLLGSWPAGLAAGALVALFDLAPWVEYGQFYYSLLVLLVAGALAAWAREDTRASRLALGAALGTSLLYRSTLAALPPLLALTRQPLRKAPFFSVGLMPYLFLLPWAWMNWRVRGESVLFERAAAGINAASAALGLVRPMDSGAWLASPASDAPWRWALGEALSHPLRYALGFLARAGYAASRHPFLLLAAGLALYLNRSRREFRLLGLLAAYFLAANCLLSVRAHYFLPLWPVLAALAAALVCAKEPSAPQRAAARGAVRAAGAGALALALFAIAVVLRYPGPETLTPWTAGWRRARGTDGPGGSAPARAWTRAELDALLSPWASDPIAARHGIPVEPYPPEEAAAHAAPALHAALHRDFSPAGRLDTLRAWDALEPARRAAWLELSRALTPAADCAEQEALLGSLAPATRAHGVSAKLHAGLGLCAQQAGDPARAVSLLERAIALDPASLEPYATLAAVHLGSGRRREALAVYSAALRAQSDPSPLRDRLAADRAALLASSGG